MPGSSQYMADVSSNNGIINVANYSRAGHAIIAIKATQGINYYNPFHNSQADEAHEFGLTVLHYHWFTPGESIDQQIRIFRNRYNQAWRNGDFICYDVETQGTKPQEVQEILLTTYRLTGHSPILYTYRDFFERILKGITVPGRQLWIADYSESKVIVPKNKYDLWAKQYTDGKLGPEPHFYSGIGQCDGSIINRKLASQLLVRKLRTRRRK